MVASLLDLTLRADAVDRIRSLLDLALKVGTVDEIRNLVVVGLLARGLGLGLHVLVALGQLAQRRKRVRAELVQDARYELSELLVLTIAVDGKGVGRNRGVHCGTGRVAMSANAATNAATTSRRSVARTARPDMHARLTLRRRKVNHIPVLLEHVDLLDGLDRLHIELLQRRLKLLVVGARSLRRPLNLAAGSTLATTEPIGLVLPTNEAIPHHSETWP